MMQEGFKKPLVPLIEILKKNTKNGYCTIAKVGKGGYILELFFHQTLLNIKYSLEHLQELTVCQNVRLEIG